MAEFYRKLILTPDVLFDTLEDYPPEVFVEVFRAVRAYVHYWDNHRTDNGFDVSGLSPDARAVFRSVIKQMRAANSDYFGRTMPANPEIIDCPAAIPETINETSDNSKSARAAELAKRKAQISHRRKKDKKRVQKHREKKKNLKALQKQCSRLSGQEIAEISAESNEKSVTKSASNPCQVKDSGDFCGKSEKSVTKSTSKPYPESDSGDFCSRVYNNYYLNSSSKELLDTGKGGKGEKQVLHNSSSVDKSNNQTSGLSCSKAVPIAAVPAIGGSKEERRSGSSEDGAAAVGQNVCCGQLDNNSAIAGSNAVGGLRPESATKAKAAARAAKNFNLLSAPHTPTENEILITKDFKIDLEDEFFNSYRRADRFLIKGVENWLIANKLGNSVEKRWICRQIYKFAERQGKVSVLLGITPEEYQQLKNGGHDIA